MSPGYKYNSYNHTTTIISKTKNTFIMIYIILNMYIILSFVKL